MKITKSRLKEIIKEELSLMDSSKEQALEEGLLDNAIQRQRAAGAQVPEEDREEHDQQLNDQTLFHFL